MSLDRFSKTDVTLVFLHFLGYVMLCVEDILARGPLLPFVHRSIVLSVVPELEFGFPTVNAMTSRILSGEEKQGSPFRMSASSPSLPHIFPP